MDETREHFDTQKMDGKALAAVEESLAELARLAEIRYRGISDTPTDPSLNRVTFGILVQCRSQEGGRAGTLSS
ncbi:MAG: hypothetical protein GY696_19830 [Gammaproteobacteria bacterium]|nr:hypothetical protein [Gammaproteobacteria bacterium]